LGASRLDRSSRSSGSKGESRPPPVADRLEASAPASRTRGYFLAILAVALVVRLAVAVGADTPLRYDAAEYDRNARSLAAGHGFPDTVLAEPGTPTALRPPRERSYLEMGISPRFHGLVRWSALAALALALAGAVALAAARLPRGPAFVWLVPTLLFAAILPIIGAPRYRAPIDPFLLLLGALAIATALDRSTRRQRRDELEKKSTTSPAST